VIGRVVLVLFVRVTLNGCWSFSVGQEGALSVVGTVRAKACTASRNDSMTNDSAPLSVVVAGRTPAETIAPRLSARVVATANAALAEHRTVLSLAIPYIVLGGVLLVSLGRPWPIQLLNPWFGVIWVCASAALLFWQYLKGPRHLRAAVEPSRVMGAVVVALLALPTQITFQALKQSIGHIVGFPADAFLHQFDVALHGRMPWLWFEPVLRNAGAVQLLDALYMFWFVGLIGFVSWAGWSRFRELRERALVALLLLWIVGGTLMASVGASAGPVYYGHAAQAANPYADLIQRLDLVEASHGPLFARANQWGLWELHSTDRWGALAGISAMPSLHVGLAVLLALVAGQRSRRLAAVLWIYAVLIQVGSVVLGWHYAIDGYAGALTAGATWVAAGRLCQRRAACQVDSAAQPKAIVETVAR
jgi:membrane-associated phospholipid phosphatase